MKYLKNQTLFIGVSLLILSGCEEEMMSQSSSSGETIKKELNEVSKTQQTSDQPFLVYMGKDELAEYRTTIPEQKTGEMIDAFVLSTQWETFSNEELFQTMQSYLEKEGYEDAPVELIIDYLSEGYQNGTLSDNVYNDAKSIAEYLEESVSDFDTPAVVTGLQWDNLDDMQQLLIAEQVLQQNDYYALYLSHYDMESVPPQVLVDSVEWYLSGYSDYEQLDVVYYMNTVIEDMMLSNDRIRIALEHLADGFAQKDAYELDTLFPKRFDAEVLTYADIALAFEFVETIKINPIRGIYYGIADMTFSFEMDEEKLAEYEALHGVPYPKATAFNDGKAIQNEKSRTLVVIQKNDATEFGFDIRSISALDQDETYLSEFAE